MFGGLIFLRIIELVYRGFIFGILRYVIFVLFIYETTDYTLQNLKLLNNATKTMPWGAKDHDYPMALHKKKRKENLN